MTQTESIDHPQQAARRALVEHRSRQLLDAAATLMEREGSEAVSMQALATEAGVSVGLIYRYFGSKEDVLYAVIVDVLDALATALPAALEDAPQDPVRRLAATFTAYCTVIDSHRHSTLLTYRESKSLDAERRERIKDLELETAQPLMGSLRDGVSEGLLVTDDAELVAYDLILMAHAWALKSWYFTKTRDLESYISSQLALALRGIVAPKHRSRYADLLH
ncbi:TetR/AcrR family transcriptional regulator [Flexivirga oryzae]|uniref:AcrR family transcriptional regulator n=1 Tax=Flexivirga oryzae TaxID=1794944 RepID=A0A839NEF0_9MICO|nr:TetR/AcrR family transcriptional regulator [Flexivirga oryzae]MBB2893535.1 AcrR family transcriptional regulator [Flexivirga oryzae]